MYIEELLFVEDERVNRAGGERIYRAGGERIYRARDERFSRWRRKCWKRAFEIQPHAHS